MLSSADPFENFVSLLGAHGAFGDCPVQALADVASADIPQHLLATGGVWSCSEAFGFLGGESARRHQLVGLSHRPFETSPMRLGRVMIHTPHFIETRCRRQVRTVCSHCLEYTG